MRISLKKKTNADRVFVRQQNRKIIYRVKWQIVMQWLCVRVHAVITTLYDMGEL